MNPTTTQEREMLAVSEYFYSLQGEGRTMGVPAIFLRLTGCNLICGGQGAQKDGVLRDGATWICDTMAVWMRGESYDFADLLQILEEKVDFLRRLRAGVHLVVTGGEPLLQQARLLAFLQFLEEKYALRPIVEIETNATVLPMADLDERVHYWNVSPKLSNSGMPEQRRRLVEVMHWFSENPKTMLKFVLRTVVDWAEIEREWVQEGLAKRSQIVLMPAAAEREDLQTLLETIAQICIREQVRMSSRLHIEIWNQKTGV